MYFCLEIARQQILTVTMALYLGFSAPLVGTATQSPWESDPDFILVVKNADHAFTMVQKK